MRLSGRSFAGAAAGLALSLICGTAAPAAEAHAATPAVAVTVPKPAPKVVGIVLYPGFEVLDVFGPIEMWSYAPGLRIVTIAQHAGPVRSAQGVLVTANYDFTTAPPLDIMMVPGGMGTYTELKNPVLMKYLRAQDRHTQFTASVCTGSALLAKAGLLKNHRATSNKMLFSLAVSQDASVDWVKHARWVEDGKYITSSGVSAGTDMALSLLARLYGKKQAEQLARSLEYRWNEDPTNDPFAIE